MINSPDYLAFDQLIQQALAASQNNDSGTALRLFTEAAQQQPLSGIPHFLAGAEYAQLGKMAEAEAAYANAVLLAPHLTIARFQLGLLQFTSARPAIALVTWQPLLDLHENDHLRLFTLGFAELAQDGFDKALAFFEEGMAANLTNPPLNTDIARVVSEIRKLQNKSQESSQERTDEAAMTEDGSHFLLGTYRQHNQLH
ncbi:MAG: hypothetical protein HYS18_05640 [Burkholderiales bacterium]|nr:hypothetical protein [Burkholderiales bacterium]